MSILNSMNYKQFILVLVFTLGLFGVQGQAQTPAESSKLVAQAVPDRTVFFTVTDTGVPKPIIWGLDLTLFSEENTRCGLAFMGADRVDLFRASFQPTHLLVDGDLQGQQITELHSRLNLIGLTGAKTKVALN